MDFRIAVRRAQVQAARRSSLLARVEGLCQALEDVASTLETPGERGAIAQIVVSVRQAQRVLGDPGISDDQRLTLIEAIHHCAESIATVAPAMSKEHRALIEGNLPHRY